MQDVPKIVIDRLQTAASADPHPEPDLLAAWAEQSLVQHERQQVINHLANCPACRDVMVLAMPLHQTASRSLPPQVRAGWLSRPLLRWSFAGVAALAVLGVALLQYDQRQKPNAAEVTSPLPPARLGDPSWRSFPASPNAPESSAESTSKPRIQVRQGLPPGNARALGQASAETSAKNGVLAESPESAAVATASDRSSDALVRRQASAGWPYQTPANADVVKAKPAVAAPSSPGAQAMPAPPAMPLQTSPSLMMRASPRWSITATGGLQRSFDAGKTWEDVSISVTNEQIQAKPVLRVVAAVGPEVWVGGSAAVLYHSIDSGNRWLQVFPSSEGRITPTGDISRIEFSDPQNGKVATSTGEIWITADGGLTWQKLQ